LLAIRERPAILLRRCVETACFLAWLVAIPLGTLVNFNRFDLLPGRCSGEFVIIVVEIHCRALGAWFAKLLLIAWMSTWGIWNAVIVAFLAPAVGVPFLIAIAVTFILAARYVRLMLRGKSETAPRLPNSK
jgi:hypothetical protein